MSSSRQGFLRNVKVTPAMFRLGLNLWPPFRGAGIRVARVSDDYREIDVALKLGLFNRNYFGTQFGGSMYAMTDPFHALMMFHNLGREYVVWDKAGAIRFVKPGRGRVHARLRMPAEAIERAREATAGGDKHEPTFSVDVVDESGTVIAVVEKTLKSRAADGRETEAPLRIGIIGFTPPNIMQWDKRNLDGKVYAKGLVEAAREFVPKLRAENVDLVVAISHGGIDVSPYGTMMENANWYLAEEPGIDVLLLGHSHAAFPEPNNPKSRYANLPDVDNQRGFVHARPGRVDHRTRLAQLLPQRVADVGHDGGEQLHRGHQRFALHRQCLAAAGFQPADLVAQFHHRGDGGVEGQPPAAVVADLGDGFVQLAAQLALGPGERACIQRHRRAGPVRRRRGRCDLHAQPHSRGSWPDRRLGLCRAAEVGPFRLF